MRQLCRPWELVHAVDPFEQEPVAGAFRYFRLHGRTGYRYRSTESDLKQLAEMCRGRSAYILSNHVSMWQYALRFEGLRQRGERRKRPLNLLSR